MAGESPDRSESQRSSEETTEGPGRVPSAPEDAAGPDDGSGAEDTDGDARLRAAVAAWVAADESDGAEDGASEAESEPEADAESEEAGSEDGGEPAAKSDLPVRRPSGPSTDEPDENGKKDGKDEAGDQPTTMFGAVRRQPSDDEGTKSAAERAERMTSAFFGSSRRRTDDEAASEDEGETPDPSERPTGTPPADDAEEAPAAAEPDDTDDGPDDGDQDTAMLRAPRSAPRKDQPTTAIRLPGKSDGQDKDEEKGDGEGTSRFVPLRSLDDAPRTAGRELPPEQPAPAPAPVPASTPAPGPEPGAAALTGTERTKQQPVPDPEPLDLLAQLTNTPPPPETPLRTTVRRFKIWTPLVVLLGIVFVIAQAVRPLPEPAFVLSASQSYTFDGSKPSLPWSDEGQAYVEVSGLGVLGRHGEAKPVPIGSVAKTMTAYLVLKKSPLKEGDDGPKITIDAKAEEGGTHGQGNGGESVLDTVHAGQQISERDALSALMIPSANNIARLLARWYTGGSEAEFVKKMNETADALGMDDTTYTDPSGLKPTTVSTAEDQVKLGKKVVEMPELMKITSSPTWTDPSGKTWRNWNHLVPFNGAIGIKTGTTTAAGGNLLFAGRKNVGGTTQVIVGAVLGQHKPPIIDTVTAVSKDLLIAAGEALQANTVVRKGQIVGYVDDQLGGRTPVVATKDVTAVGWAGLEVPLGLEAGAQPVPHRAQAGDEVGVLTVGDGPGQVRVPVALKKDLTEPGFGAKLTRVL